MTYTHRDPGGEPLYIEPDPDSPHGPAVFIQVGVAVASIPLDRIEELVAGIRDTARQAAGVTPDHRHTAALHYMGVTNIPTEQP